MTFTAQVAGISCSMLNRLSRRHLGKTPVVFLQELRMNRIRDLLDSTELPLAEIARQTGYGSAMSLSLAFKRAAGDTPGAYRNSRRREAVMTGKQVPEPSGRIPAVGCLRA